MLECVIRLSAGFAATTNLGVHVTMTTTTAGKTGTVRMTCGTTSVSRTATTTGGRREPIATMSGTATMTVANVTTMTNGMSQEMMT